MPAAIRSLCDQQHVDRILPWKIRFRETLLRFAFGPTDAGEQWMSLEAVSRKSVDTTGDARLLVSLPSALIADHPQVVPASACHFTHSSPLVRRSTAESGPLHDRPRPRYFPSHLFTTQALGESQRRHDHLVTREQIAKKPPRVHLGSNTHTHT